MFSGFDGAERGFAELPGRRLTPEIARMASGIRKRRLDRRIEQPRCFGKFLAPAARPSQSSSMATDNIKAVGLAMPRPAMSGADPWAAWAIP